MTQLRGYQHEAVDGLRSSLAQGNRRPLLQLPTGGGKTIIAAEIIHGALKKSKRVLFLAPRRELIYQAADKFGENWIDTGIIMAGERPNWAKVQIASFDTLHARCIRSNRMELPDADVILCDEAHLSLAKSRRDILDKYADKVIIGLTATPARGDGRGMGELYDDMILSWSVSKLIEHGYLCPVRYFAPSKPDLSGLKLNKNGDYQENKLGEIMDKPELVGDILHNWKRIARGKSTVVFCTTKAHSRHMCEEFNNAGYKAEHIDCDTPNHERAEIMRRVASKETLILCNVYVASYGLDIPSLECAVIARPTKSLVLYLQTVGRVLRPSEGKEYATVIDHSGCIEENGFVEDYVPWSLDSKKNAKEKKIELKKEAGEPKEIICGDCGTVFKARRDCPACGHCEIGPSEPIPVYQADLKEVTRGKLSASEKRNRTSPWDEKINFYRMLLGYASQKGFSSGWIAHKYKSRFSVWPNDNRLKDLNPLDPDETVLNFIKYENIRYHKSKDKRAAA